MKRNIKFIAVSLICIISVAGCKDFLRVQPKNKYLEKQVYNSVDGIEAQLTGIYRAMSQKSLYGGNLTMSMIEALAQRFNLPSFSKWSDFTQHTYDEEDARIVINNVWTDAYKLILNINAFLENLKQTSGVLTKEHKKQLKGEAYGLRAMMYFDLLRLFGPVYKKDHSALSIPYYKKVSAETHNRLPANVVLKKILNDLKKAEQLLSVDSIIKHGISRDSVGTLNYFTDNRNRRMNYYAVKALEARVYLWGGRNVRALAAAKTVIKAQKNKGYFPWVKPTKVSEHPLFPTEVIFGLYNKNINERFKELFSSSATLNKQLVPLPGRLQELYNNNINDYRYKAWFEFGSAKNNKKHFVKYENDYYNFQPLIRISEMYLIAAETVQNKGRAVDYLNEVRNHRGLRDLPNTVKLRKAITQAYRREFYGEGQLWFYYKRIAKHTIPSGKYTCCWSTMNKSKYVIPVPLSESDF